jgi:2-dehydro-3-deoxygluconokinase
MTEPFDLIALGETMLSLVAVDGPLPTAAAFHATIGGAESNTCVGLARLGMRTSWISRLGEDEAGRRVRDALGAAGVDLTWVETDANRPTGLMLRDTEGAFGTGAWGRPPARSNQQIDGAPIAEAQAVLVTGITAMLGPGPQRAAIAFLERARGLRVVDPNLRLGLWGSARAAELVLPLIERCDVLLGGEAELAKLVGGSGRALAERCVTAGASEVVLTRGSLGAAALDRDGSWHELPAPPVRERDPVGAGDAFNAGYIAARLRGDAVAEALEAGIASGAVAAATSRRYHDDRGGAQMTRDARQPDGLPGRRLPTAGGARRQARLDIRPGRGGRDRRGRPRRDRGQTRQVLYNVEAMCLAAAGCTMDDVVKVTAFLADAGTSRRSTRSTAARSPNRSQRGRRSRWVSPPDCSWRSKRSR